MYVIVKRITIIFERLGNAVTIGVPETLAFALKICYHGVCSCVSHAFDGKPPILTSHLFDLTVMTSDSA